MATIIIIMASIGILLMFGYMINEFTSESEISKNV
jgi:hypothetical protein